MTSKQLALLGGAHVHLDDHLTHLTARGWRVSHLHERDPARRAVLCDRLEARQVSPCELKESGCLGAVVCSETVHHEEDILAALRAGLPVFVEKPMAGSAVAAKRCAKMARQNGLALHCGYFLRTNAALRRLHTVLQAGRLGRIIEASMRFSHDGGYADWLDLDCWMTDPVRACYGGFADEAVHVIDALQWLLGPIRAGQAVTGNALGWPVDDHGAALLQFESGAMGVVEAGWTDWKMRLELDFVGTEGWARLQEGRLQIGRRGQEMAAEEIALSALDAGAGIDPFLNLLEGVEARGLVPPEDAVRVNELLDQMDLALI